MSKKGNLSNTPKSKLRQQRVFSDTFKRQKVQELDSGLITVPELSKLYKVSVQSIYRWLHKYSINHQKGIRQVVQMESEAKKTKQLLERVAELERVIGQKQLHIDYLEMLVQISSEELNVDLKKNFDIKCCPTSKDCLDQKDLS